MRCPPPKFTLGVNIPIQGINVSVKSQNRLVIYSRSERHYRSVGCELNLSMMKWMVLEELDLHLTSLEYKKEQYDPDVTAMKKKDQYFVKWLEELLL